MDLRLAINIAHLLLQLGTTVTNTHNMRPTWRDFALCFAGNLGDFAMRLGDITLFGHHHNCDA